MSQPKLLIEVLVRGSVSKNKVDRWIASGEQHPKLSSDIHIYAYAHARARKHTHTGAQALTNPISYSIYSLPRICSEI